MAKCKHPHYEVVRAIVREACGKPGCDFVTHRLRLDKIAICLDCRAQGQWHGGGRDQSERASDFGTTDRWPLYEEATPERPEPDRDPHRDAQGRDANEMYQHYLSTQLVWVDINLLEKTARHAALFLAYITAFGPNVIPHVMDDDDNPGEYLRRDLRELGLWETGQ